MFNPFVRKIYLFIVLYNALLYLTLIRPVFCIGAKPNWNKVRKKKASILGKITPNVIISVKLKFNR